MGLTRTVAPATEPLSLAEVTTHLRLDTSNTSPHPTVVTVALISPAAAGNVDNGAHRYRATFVTSAGETDGGDISAAVTVVDKTVNGKVTVSAIPLGGSAVTSRKLYRTVAGGSTYFLLATIADNTTTSYTDNIADSSLGAAVPSANGTADPEVTALITSARGWAEGVTHRALITQTWRLTLDEFPRCYRYRHDRHDYPRHRTSRAYEILLPWPNLLSVTAISYVDTAGATQTLDVSTDIIVDTASLPGRILPAYGTSWPTTRYQANAVTIDYTAGYGNAASVPQEIKHAMLLTIGDLYRSRESRAVGAGITITPNPAVDALLGPYLVRDVA